MNQLVRVHNFNVSRDGFGAAGEQAVAGEQVRAAIGVGSQRRLAWFARGAHARQCGLEVSGLPGG